MTDKTNAELRAELDAALQSLVGKAFTPENRKTMEDVIAGYMSDLKSKAYEPKDIEVTSCEVEADGLMHVRVRVAPHMADLFLNAGWELK